MVGRVHGGTVCRRPGDEVVAVKDREDEKIGEGVKNPITLFVHRRLRHQSILNSQLTL